MNQLKTYTDFLKGIVFFLTLAVLMVIFTGGWQGAHFGYGAHTATKAQYLHAIFVVYSVIIGIVSAVIAVLLVFNYFLSFVLQKFPMLQPQLTLSDYVKGILLFALSAVIAYGIMAIVVYEN